MKPSNLDIPDGLVLPSIEELKASIARDRYLNDPAAWVRDRLGESPWSKQVEILESVRDNRRTAVRGCHSPGKSWVSSRAAAHWIESHAPGDAFVVTSAPTNPQVRAILWREIGRAHTKGKLRGRTNQTEWWMDMPGGNEELVAFGRKPSDIDMAAFQGVHARFVLVIFDEAAGIPTLLWEAADTLISNEHSRFLAIGNPDDPASEFARVCSPGSGWNSIKISAYDTPAFTGEKVPPIILESLVSPIWVEEKRKKWGENNPLYISKILAEFPTVTDDTLIPMEWIRAAQERELAETEPKRMGVDVGAGGNKTTTALRKGDHVRVIRESGDPDTMATTGTIGRDIKINGVEICHIDEVGIGRGVVDRAKEMKLPVRGINVGKVASDPEQYLNLRAEGYWQLRERFESGNIDIDPNDEDLAAQLGGLKFKITSNGKIQMESKVEMRRRGMDSPDRADAVMLSFLEKRKITRATWGR